MTTDLIARIEQLQIELDEAQRIANNNHQLYTQAKAQRDSLLSVLKSVTKALPVLETMCRVAGLRAGEETAKVQVDLVRKFVAVIEQD